MEKQVSPELDALKKLGKRLDLQNRYTDSEVTVLFSANYYNSTGVVMRCSGKREKLGYCVESTKQVLERLMPDFHVTSYCGMEFYDVSDSGAPLKGIAIGDEKLSGVYGKKVVIDGKLDEILEVNSDLFNNLKRKEPLSDKEKLRIVGDISVYSQNKYVQAKRFQELMSFLTSVRG